LPTNLGVLLDYGRHLLGTVRHRAAAPSFSVIAVRFGTANLTTIFAHLNRGILRAQALERMLLARAAAGRDIIVPLPRGSDQDTPTAPQGAAPAASPRARPRPAPPDSGDGTEVVIPSPQELDRQVRHRSIGRTIIEICSDLAVVPGFCTAAFWNDMFEVVHCLRGSVANLMEESVRRRTAFAQEQDKTIGSTWWQWVNLPADAERKVLGFFIGEPPYCPTEAPATGPP
jgi:hypothetical protein